jgi:hypothetical protein
MPRLTLYPSGPPSGVDLGPAGAVVTNYGDGTVSYSDTADPFVAEGTIAANGTATLYGTQFFRATDGATIFVAPSPGSSSSVAERLQAVESSSDAANDPQGAVVRSAAPFVTGRMRLRDKWSAVDFGVRFNGSEETAGLKTALSECRAAARTLWLPEGEVIVNGQVTTTGQTTPVRVRGEGEGRSTIVQAAASSPVFAPTGTTTANGTLPAGAARRDAALTLDSTDGLQQYDYLKLLDPSAAVSGSTDEEPQTGNSSRGTVGYPGEWVQIRSVDSSTVVSLYGRIGFAYTAGSTVRKASFIRGCDFRHFGFRWDTTVTPNGFARAIILTNCLDSAMSDLQFDKAQAAQIYVTSSLGWRVKDCNFIAAQDWEDVTAPYNIVAGGASQSGLITGCRGRYGRHMLTVAGSTTDFAGCHVLMADCIANYYHGASFDTHPGGRWIVFANCFAHNCYGDGFQIRGRDTTIINPQVNAAVRGVYIVDGASRCRVLGGRLRHCDTGVEIADSDAVKIAGDLHIDEATTYGIRVAPVRSPWIGEMQTFDVDNATISGNPASGAINFGHWKAGFRVGPGVRIPDATSKIVGASNPVITAAATLTVPA